MRDYHHDAAILAVDDEPTNLELLEQILRRDGYRRIHAIADPRTVIAEFERQRPDIVLLDLNMPHISGLEILEGMRRRTGPDAYLPIVILTADATPETRRRALAEGATDYLVKPLDTVEVRLRVRNLLQARHLHLDLQQERDRLEQRVAERTRELEAAHAAVVAADKLKSQFIALASHEMRTPLTIVKGFTEVLLHRNDQVDPQRRLRHLEAVLRNADRLERLVDDLLMAAQLEAESTEGVKPFDLHPQLIDLGEAITTAASSSGIEPSDLVIERPSGREVSADPVVVERIVSNLLSNAQKYGAPPIEVSCSSGTTRFSITVRDHGAGVPCEFVDRLFDQFSQASVGDRRTAQGTGLGLWIVRQLAQLHGGDVSYEPATPRGAKFHVVLRQLLPRRDQPTME